ncbi:MAG: ribonuclease H-like domain-containing protein [Halodesulfurarchaeum sp.]
MTSEMSTARLACASPEFVTTAPRDELEDWLEYFDPDAVVLTGGGPAPRAASDLRRLVGDTSDVFHPAGVNSESGALHIGGISFVTASTIEGLESVASNENAETSIPNGQPSSTRTRFVITPLLELDVDTTSLSTTLIGLDEYVSALPDERLRTDVIHISTRLPAGYRREWDGLSVVGGGVESGTGGTPLIALDFRRDGTVLGRTVRPSRLGLRALDGVGSVRADQLREAGYSTRDSLVDATTGALTDVDGFGRTTVERVQNCVRAMTENEIVRKSDDPLPVTDPVYIDIETDGLAPTITWLIGVLDGSAEDGTFTSFVQKDLENPGRAIEDFMSWYTANADDRPIVAYNGWRFDFEVLHEHILEYCPHYEADWTSTDRFDPYQWAVTGGNAILPARTNTLEDVAVALGFEPVDSSLTGAAVAKAYRQWMIDGSPDTEPDWGRFETYCEDDVRALAVVFEALEASGRIISDSDGTKGVAETTTQGDLSNW